MNYSDIKDADDLSGCLMEGMSDLTLYMIYKSLCDMGDARIHEAATEGTSAQGRIEATVAEHFYCAGYNLVEYMTDGTHLPPQEGADLDIQTVDESPQPAQEDAKPIEAPRSKIEPGKKYEFFYNIDYLTHNNPSLMGFGTTGGYGGARAGMVEAVARADFVHAEKCFWTLIEQSIQEMLDEELADDATWNLHTYMVQWLGAIHSNRNGIFHEERHFVREQSPYQEIMTDRC